MAKRMTDERTTVQRPELSRNITTEQFCSFYYLKEELIQFCRREKLQTSGSKADLTERVAVYLNTGKKTFQSVKRTKSDTNFVIRLNSRIEENFVCSERHRSFFLKEIGPSFKFCVGFQRWLKTNIGRTYREAIEAYDNIVRQKRVEKSTIDHQFEYNTYIRVFFAANKGKTLQEAILCWKHKKSLPGNNKYEADDLLILKEKKINDSVVCMK